MQENKEFLLITGTANLPLSKDIGNILGKKPLNPISKFADGEIKVKLQESLKHNEIFIVQPTSKPVSEHVIELFLMVDAARRAGAINTTVVIPYYGYSRQDRKDAPRVPISSALISEILENLGVSRIITVDIHSDQQQGFFRGPWDNLYGSSVLIPEIKKTLSKNLVVVSPDKGGTARANAFAKRIDADGIAVVFKERDTNIKNESKVLGMIGNVKNKDTLLVDDMIDTAGTMCNAAELLIKRGANSVYVAATHGIFSGEALSRIKKSPIKKVWVTDTIRPNSKVRHHKKIKIVFVANLIARAIEKNLEGDSLSDDLID